MEIKKIFDIISEREGHEFIPYETYEPKTEFFVLDEHGEKVKVLNMITKKEPVISVQTDKGSFRAGKNHIIMTSEGLRHVEELKIGDILPSKDGDAVIQNLEVGQEELLYDFAVDSKTQLYQDADGFIHHNSFHVEKTMKEILGSPDGPNAKWRYRKGAKVSPFGLYMDLFANRADMTIVYDDSDSIFYDKDMVNIIKSAVDTYPVREISWPSRNTVNLELMDDEEREEYLAELQLALKESPEDVGTKIKLPSKFKFTSRIIFITNMPGAKFEKDPNLSAIKSRAFFMDIQLKREDDVKRIKTILPYIEPDVDMKLKEEIVDQLAAGDSQLTMRAVIAAIAIRKAGLSDWDRLVREYA